MPVARLIALFAALLFGVTIEAAEWPQGRSIPALDAHLQSAFSPDAVAPLSGVRAVLVVQGGAVVGERYRAGFDASTRFLSWSMAKSFVHALAGIQVREGRIGLDTPLPVPEWNATPDDPRAAITLDQALRMSTGLRFDENYEDLAHSDAIRMLFGDGAADMGKYAASQPLVHAPGTFWDYSSGTTNVISRVLRDLSGGTGESYRAFIDRELLEPLGIEKGILEFDAAGTLIASSLIFLNARDYARFGQLYLQDGVWNGKRILPAGWAQHARMPTTGSNGRYGAQWWLSYASPARVATATKRFPVDAFMARGHQEQAIIVLPSHDLVIVCLSLVNERDVSALQDYLASIVDLVAQPGAAQP